MRLPVAMIEDLKILANQRDVPYQSLLKVFLAERLKEERNQLFIEQRPDGGFGVRRSGVGRARAVESTQADAIERARGIAPQASILVERVRNTNVGGRDKWRKP